MTLSPCRTLQNVIHTQKCVPFAKVSKPKEEDLKPTGKAFQLLGPATAKDLWVHYGLIKKLFQKEYSSEWTMMMIIVEFFKKSLT